MVEAGTWPVQIDDTQYLVIVDYFSKYPVIYGLKHTISAEVLMYSKEHLQPTGVTIYPNIWQWIPVHEYRFQTILIRPVN